MSDDEATSRFALAVLTMRINTPDGQWLQGSFQDYYSDEMGPLDESDLEMLFLHGINLADHLVTYLVAATGLPESHWLEQLREDYVAREDGDG